VETTDGMSLEDAASLLTGATESEETETEHEEPEEDQTEEAPDAELDDAEEVEEETDDADDGDTVEDQDDEDQEDAGLEEFVTVKVDGQEKQVTLEDLKRSYSGQGYIQKGMQEAATQKREAEQVFQQLQQEREQFSQFMQNLQTEGLVQEPKLPDPQLLETDPIGFMQKKAAYDSARQQYDQQQQELQRAQSQQTEAQRQALQAYTREQTKLLHDAIPDLADPEKGTAAGRELVEAGGAYGFTAEEITKTLDHRALVVLNDAMKYRKLRKSTAAQKAEKSRPALKPKARQKQDPAKVQREKQMQRFHETGSLEDAVDLMFE